MYNSNITKKGGKKSCVREKILGLTSIKLA